MKNPKHLDLMINVAGAIIGLAVVAYVVYAAFRTEAAEPCSTRYPGAMRFSLQTSEGKPLTAIELQARAGVRDLGVIDNASVVRVEGGPAPEALEVKLRQLPTGADTGDKTRNGIEFHWTPPGIGAATSACLAYSLWIPDKFDFGAGGFLPGILGKASPSPGGQQGRLSVSPQWDNAGKPLLGVVSQDGAISRLMARSTPLPTNQWIKVEQEVVLNDPAKANGLVRLWIDGSLIIENHELALRQDAKALLAGVLAAIGYRTPQAQPGTLRLSPFEVSWR